MGRREREPEHQPPHFDQLTFEAFETETIEVSLFNCTVETKPLYQREGKSYTWHCLISAPPDVFNPDQEGQYELHAKNYAKEANKQHVQPGDVIHVTGVPWKQTIDLKGGKQTIINHLNVSHITPPRRCKAPSPQKDTSLKNFWIATNEPDHKP